MAKFVYPTHEIPHIWMHSWHSQEYARNPSGNLYFNERTIYSYGSHFPVAKHVNRGPTGRERWAVLLTDRRYSVTTARHVSAVELACCGTVFVVHDPIEADKNPAAQFARYKKQLKALLLKWHRARSRKPYILGEIENLVRDANGFADFFKLRAKRLAVPNAGEMETEAREIIERYRKQREKREAKHRKAIREREKRQHKALAAWLAGDGDNCCFSGPIRLRLVGDLESGTVETTAGASFPADHAVKAYRILLRLKKSGSLPWERNGQEVRLGHYRIDCVEADGTIVAGCHRIEWAEVERLATAAGIA